MMMLWIIIYSESAKFTFDNFVVAPSNRFTYCAAMDFTSHIDNASDDYPSILPLLIYDEKGVGKSHLLNAIRNELQKRDSKLKIAFVDKENSISKISDDIDVLLVDDVQLFMNDEFFNIYNSFVKNKQAHCTYSG